VTKTSPFDDFIETSAKKGHHFSWWDGNKFPHSVDMINNVASKGRKMVTIVDPHLKKEFQFGGVGKFICFHIGCWPVMVTCP
jgi:hypothetical protein